MVCSSRNEYGVQRLELPIPYLNFCSTAKMKSRDEIRLQNSQLVFRTKTALTIRAV